MSGAAPELAETPERSASGASEGAAPALHLLQSLLAPRPDRPAGLYLRASPDFAEPPAPDDPAGAPITMAAGSRLSTDTFFGSFYRAYWRSVGGPDRLILAVELSGTATIRVMEDAGQGAKCLVAQRVDGRTRLAVPPASGAASRLFVEVEALADCRLGRLDWMCDRPPRRTTTLSIGLCTFNQEAYLARTLASLVSLADRLPALTRIHLVNQGAPFASEALRALCRDPRVKLVEQRNLGGCGGFSRSLAEELAEDEPASHHLLMDDDIILDERMIARTLHFLDHAREEVALGAGMFEAQRPEMMYEAGAYILEENRIEAYCRDVNLADPAQSGHFDSRVETDFNAWWFCILPIAAVRRVGMPTPVFIRGDDFDYGLRMLRAGIATVTLPGIGVWHDSFHAKPSGWQDYYDLRNRLILAATNPGRIRQLPFAHVTGMVTSALLTHNYTGARLRLLALADFLKGPSLFEEDAERIHRRVMEIARGATAETLGPEWADRPVRPPGPPRSEKKSVLMRQHALSFLRTLLLPHRRGDVVVMDTDAQPHRVAGASYVLTNRLRSYHLRFTPDRGRLLRLMRETYAMARRYRSEVSTTSDDWNSAIDTYRQPDFWQHVFAAEDGTH